MLEKAELEEENRKLKANSYNELQRLWLENYELREENKKLKEEIRFLEQCLDNKEKVNKSLREELWWYKRQYKHSMWED